MVEYADMCTKLEEIGAEHHASELHGLVAGYVCSGHRGDGTALLLDWLGDSPDSRIHNLIDQLIHDIGAMLADPEFGFQPLVPDEGCSLNERGRAISRWCMGFISGFGAAASIGPEALEEEVREVLSDLDTISRMTQEIPDSEENEADYTEVLEYVRVSALLVFATYGVPVEKGDE